MVRFRIKKTFPAPPPATRWWRLLTALALCNNVIVFAAALALIAACAILSYSVLGRALFHSANYWQDEAAVFLLVGATFMTAAYVQGQRGHIGIEAFIGLMSPRANPDPAVAGRCREPLVLRLLCLEILDAGARGMG